jgi:hypothetical protein
VEDKQVSDLKRKVVVIETQKTELEVEDSRLNVTLGDSTSKTDVTADNFLEEYHHLIKLANRDLDSDHLTEKDFRFLRNYVDSGVTQIEEYESEETTVHQERTSYLDTNQDNPDDQDNVFGLKAKIQTLQSRITYVEFELSSRDATIQRLKKLTASQENEIGTEKTEMISEDSPHEDLRAIIDGGGQEGRISIDIESMATHNQMHWHLGKKSGFGRADTGEEVIDDFVNYSEGVQEVKTQYEVKKSVTQEFSSVTNSGTKEFSSVTQSGTKEGRLSAKK